MSRMLTTTEIEGKRSLIFCRDERVTRQSANREARFPISSSCLSRAALNSSFCRIVLIIGLVRGVNVRAGETLVSSRGTCSDPGRDSPRLTALPGPRSSDIMFAFSLWFRVCLHVGKFYKIVKYNLDCG